MSFAFSRPAARREGDYIGSCASCSVESCFLNIERKRGGKPAERVAFLLDEAWPEFEAYLSEKASTGDIMIASLNGGLLRLPRYAWGVPAISQRKYLTVPALLRTAASRRLAHESGAVRQRSNLRFDGRLAAALAGKIPYDAVRLVVSQSFLPMLHRLGMLGGRSYAVLMTRYPFRTLHEKLDAASREHPESPTLSDFRVDGRSADDEWRALENADALICCHEDIASLFPEKTRLLPWQTPPVRVRPPANRSRIAFLGPTLGRKGAYAVREAARAMREPLVVFGRNLEAPGFWDSVRIEPRDYSEDALDDVGTLLHPAVIEHDPRRLLKAHAQGIRIFATRECGLPAAAYEDFSTFVP